MNTAVCSLAYTYYESDPRVRRMCEALAAAGARVEAVALRKPGAAAEETIRGVRVHRLKLERHRGGKQGYFSSYGKFLLHAGWKLATLHRERPFRIVHVNTMPDFLVLAAQALRLQGCRVILDFHDMMPELFAEKFGDPNAPLVRGLRLMERASALGAHRVIAVHELQKQRLVDNGVPAAKITVVLNAPDDALFRPRPPAAASADFTFAYHGTIAPRHGVDLAVRALGLARRERPGLKLKLLGGGDGLDDVVRTIEAERLEEAVTLHQPVPVEQVPGFIAGADAAVIPLRAGPAGAMMLPTKLLEYSTLGVPTIVSRTPVVEHYFTEESVAFVEPGDVEGLAKQMLRLSGDEALRRGMAERAARVVAAQAWPRQREIYLGLIDELS